MVAKNFSVIPSKSQVKNAASTVRKYSRGEADTFQRELAIEVISAYRSTFLNPLTYVTSEVTSLCEKLKFDVDVSNRLKRQETILDKIVERQKTMDLTRMQDIGGCRVVVHTLEELRTLQSAVIEKWPSPPTNIVDYVSSPRESGYRGVHLVIYTEEELPIELQLRTEKMHEWALTVEAFSSVTGANLKQDGNHVIQQLMKLIADIHGYEDGGQKVPIDLLNQSRILLEQVKVLLNDQDSSHSSQESKHVKP